MWLPEPIKKRLRPLPQWCAIALNVPQDITRAQLRVAGCEFDVTRNNVIASLKPLTVAVGVVAGMQAVLRRGSVTKLVFIDNQLDVELGELLLRFDSVRPLGGFDLAFFTVDGGRNYCVSAPYRRWNEWLQDRNARNNKDPHNFSMTPAEIRQTLIFYLSPRPVVLASVEDGAHRNLFPMDLVGSVAGDRFTLALRSTSHSISTMKSTGRVALSDVAGKDFQIAYGLGVHHKAVTIELSSLPFEISRSKEFHLPVPSIALRVRELTILDATSIGSHTFFVCRTESDSNSSDGARFCHTSGFHLHFRRRHGLALTAAN